MTPEQLIQFNAMKEEIEKNQQSRQNKAIGTLIGYSLGLLYILFMYVSDKM